MLLMKRCNAQGVGDLSFPHWQHRARNRSAKRTVTYSKIHSFQITTILFLFKFPAGTPIYRM
jgi:hypothetical protein